MQRDDRALGPGIHARHPRLPAQPLDLHDVQKMIDFLGVFSKPVDQLGCKQVNVLARLETRQSPVKTKPQLQIGDVAFRDQDRRPQ